MLFFFAIFFPIILIWHLIVFFSNYIGRASLLFSIFLNVKDTFVNQMLQLLQGKRISDKN